MAKTALEEYKEGNKLAIEYFKAQWVATSIFIPLSFGLIPLSFSMEELLKLTWLQILPLALASIFIYFYRWMYANRYVGYCRSIWKRLREIENNENMSIHNLIDKDDRERKIEWSMKHVNVALLILLILLWVLRLVIAPILP
jgi:hypothetical protein